MGWVKTGLLAGAAEAMAYLLSLQWGFAVLMLAFIWIAGVLRAASVKAADTEKRVNALVPAVGAVKDTADTAYTNANNAQSTANSAQTAATNANNNANGRVSKGGDTIDGNLHVTGTVTADWDVHVGNYLYCNDVSGACTFHSALYAGSGLTVSGNFQAGGSVMYIVAAPTPIPGTGTLSQLTNAVNAIIGQLKNTNWMY